MYSKIMNRDRMKKLENYSLLIYGEKEKLKLKNSNTRKNEKTFNKLKNDLKQNSF